MTQGLDIQAIEDLIRANLSAAKASEIPIGPGRFGVLFQDMWRYDGSTVCLIGASVMDKPCISDPAGQFAIQIGREPTWVRRLIRGFDAPIPRTGPKRPRHEAYELGQKFRREWEQGLWG